jgi:nuclear-control-of-ATPase protein 2
LQLSPLKSTASSPVFIQGDGPSSSNEQFLHASSRIIELQNVIKALSTTSSSSPLLSSWRISTLLSQAGLSSSQVEIQIEDNESTSHKSAYESELEWLLISKATVQTYGVILNTLLEQIIPLNDDIWYWDEVLGSYQYTALYSIQTSPIKFFNWSKDIYHDTKLRVERVREDPGEELSARRIGTSLTTQWKQFYGLVRESIRDRSTADIQRRVQSPLALARIEARNKQSGLRRLREMSASGLGVLMDEGLSFDLYSAASEYEAETKTNEHEWKGVVERSVALMDTVLQNVTSLETGVSDFEDTCFASVERDSEISTLSADKPAKLSRRLENILSIQIQKHTAATNRLKSEYGRPNRLVRYWLPATVLLLSSTTLLRIAVNRKAVLLQWVQDFGSTVRDFWLNWVVEPTRKIIGTIRHDKDSEVAIMSKESLKGDRDSLERMVVDFAIDKPDAATGNSSLSEDQIAQIRAKVKEGDLTPVLRAYEKDLRRPFVGTVRGDLVRTLLIQVQKTKVDVEVAISGIDALLKSQELVFGFVGLTPGILVCFTSFRYLGSVFGNRRGLKSGRKAGQTIRVLRNIDRILSTATPGERGMLSYKDHGLLLCEVHVLRSRSHHLFPGEVEREFLEDVDELGNISIGIERQRRVVERIRWAYTKWLSK